MPQVTKNKLDKAIEDFNRAIVLNPDDALVYFSRGRAFYQLKQYAKAIDDFFKGLKLDLDNSPAYNKVIDDIVRKALKQLRTLPKNDANLLILGRDDKDKVLIAKFRNVVDPELLAEFGEHGLDRYPYLLRGKIPIDYSKIPIYKEYRNGEGKTTPLDPSQFLDKFWTQPFYPILSQVDKYDENLVAQLRSRNREYFTTLLPSKKNIHARLLQDLKRDFGEIGAKIMFNSMFSVKSKGDYEKRKVNTEVLTGK